MKDIFNEIKEQTTNRFTHHISVSAPMVNKNNELNLIDLLSQVESFLEIPKKVLSAVAPLYNKKMIQVDYQNLSKSFLGDKLEMEARFYRVDKRTVELKVFVRKYETNGKSTKIAKATYTFHAEHKGQSAA